MSFRARLTSFFILIVVVPMIAIGFLVVRLISDTEQGKADARANGVLSAAIGVYQSKSVAGSIDARTIARELGTSSGAPPSAAQVRRTVANLAGQSGLARVVVRSGAGTLADVGDPSAIAPGTARIAARRLTVTASEVTAGQFVRELAVPGAAIVVRNGADLLAVRGVNLAGQSVPTGGHVSVDGVSYRAVSQNVPGFGGSRVEITVLASVSATGGSAAGSRAFALALIAGFLLLALSFAVLASRGLHAQVSRFVNAARGLASGDFSSPIRVEGHDEFAALGEEFNNMSNQLEQRLGELSQERARLREAIGRIGETFASNLDRPALLDLALKTAIDAARADGGRISISVAPGEPLSEAIREGSVEHSEAAILGAERRALDSRDLAESRADGHNAMSIPLVSQEEAGRSHGLVTVVSGHGFSEDDRELLRSLAAQATLALENVDLHVQVSRQAVTDDLTGLANHGRFQDLLSSEIDQVRRYRYPVGLIMLDIDDFKLVNDTYGHQQGDVVLHQVARVLAETSREVDHPARYGGEELAVILPHTDLEGAYAIAERLRAAVEALRIPRLDSRGTLCVTASLGVAASAEGQKDSLIAEADAALYEAKRQGKNRTVTASGEAANVFSGE